MARFPTFDEYEDKPAKGVQRCDDLLKRDPTNVTILLTKLQLQVVLEDVSAAQKTLAVLYTRPIRNLSDISTLEEAVVELQAQSYPAPLSAGQDIAKLWDTASKTASTLNQKLDLLSLRCTRAIIDHRLADAQQSLIQLKALLPKNRIFYMAHAALTQQLSTGKDDLQSRLAVSLARKAVSEKFDEDKTLDCRVPGQIFALQAANLDLDGIKERRFSESKQVFDALRPPRITLQDRNSANLDPSTTPSKEWFNAEVSQLKAQFRSILSEGCTVAILQSFAANAIRLYKTATESLSLKTYRPISEAVFLAISALVKAWTLNRKRCQLLQAAYLAGSLLRSQPHVHEAKAILIYLYTRLGLGQPAYQQWDNLNIREIQYDTFGHTFLSQISILHPHYLTNLDPLRIVTHGLATYRRLEDKLAETHASVLNHGQTGMIFELYDLRQCLKLSATRRILALEYRRLARIFGKPLNKQTLHIQPRLTDVWLDTKDNRDFATTFNYGFNVERALHQQDEVDSWILVSLASDYVWCISTGQTSAIKDVDNLLSKLKAMNAGTPDHEQATSELMVLMLSELVTSQERSESFTPSMEAALRSLGTDELLTETSTLPDQIRQAYIFLDALQILTVFLKYAWMEGLISQAEIGNLREQTSAKLKKLQAYCKERSRVVTTQAIRSFMTEDDDVTKEITTLDANELTKYCTFIADAVRDAWTGAAPFRL